MYVCMYVCMYLFMYLCINVYGRIRYGDILCHLVGHVWQLGDDDGISSATGVRSPRRTQAYHLIVALCAEMCTW